MSKNFYSLAGLIIGILSLIFAIYLPEIRELLKLDSPPAIEQKTINETPDNESDNITIPNIQSSDHKIIKQDHKIQSSNKPEAPKPLKAAKNKTDLSSLYIANTSFLNKADSTEFVVFIIENDKLDNKISHKIAALLREKGYKATAAFFNSKFVADKIFNKLIEGNSAIIKDLNLYKYTDYLIIGRKTTSFRDNPNLENLITANVIVSINKISTALAIHEYGFDLRGDGIGVLRIDAEKKATDRICDQFSEKIKEM